MIAPVAMALTTTPDISFAGRSLLLPDVQHLQGWLVHGTALDLAIVGPGASAERLLGILRAACRQPLELEAS